VPIGEDQQQHLELTRDLAHQFNRMIKQRYFPIPQPLFCTCFDKLKALLTV